MTRAAGRVGEKLLVDQLVVHRTGRELAAAPQYDLPALVLVIDNGMFGTVRMHQERMFPGRVPPADTWPLFNWEAAESPAAGRPLPGAGGGAAAAAP